MKTMHKCITIPLTKADRDLAEKIANQYGKYQKKYAQVLENILAVCAVKNYLQILAIATDTSKNYSFNLALQLVENVADLYLTKIGRLECRPVKLNDSLCYIPAEVWSNRIGFVAVELDATYKQAKLLGFIEKVRTEELLITDLESIDSLLDTITAIELSKSVWQKIKHWAEKASERGWQTFDEVFATSQLQYAGNFRGLTRNNSSIETMIELIKNTEDELLRRYAIGVLGAIAQANNQEAITLLSHLIDTTKDDDTRWEAGVSLAKIEPSHPKSAERRVKVLNWGIDFPEYPLALIVALLPTEDQRIRVIIEVRSSQKDQTLPPNLKLALLSESNQVKKEIVSRSLIRKSALEGVADKSLEMRFILPPGQNLKISVSLNNQTLIENLSI